ncbi:hypothetical protein D3C74_306490 [compost metagenome]
MTMRLSTMSLAGTARTEVAVGTSRLASMLTTTRAAGPRSFCTSSPVSGESERDGAVATAAYGAVAGCAVATGRVALIAAIAALTVGSAGTTGDLRRCADSPAAEPSVAGVGSAAATGGSAGAFAGIWTAGAGPAAGADAPFTGAGLPFASADFSPGR